MAGANVSLRSTRQKCSFDIDNMNNSMVIIIRVSGAHLHDIVNDHDISMIY